MVVESEVDSDLPEVVVVEGVEVVVEGELGRRGVAVTSLEERLSPTLLVAVTM